MAVSRSLLLKFSVALLFTVNLAVVEGRIAVAVNNGADKGSALVPMKTETDTGIGNISTSLNLISDLVNMTSASENENERMGAGKSRCDDECPAECQTTCNGNNYQMTCSQIGSVYTCICQCTGGGGGGGSGGGSDFIQPTASLFFISAALSIIRIGFFGAN